MLIQYKGVIWCKKTYNVILVHKVYILVGEIRYKLMKPSINKTGFCTLITLYTDTIKDKLEIIRGQ